jgi:hypothetical protein
MQACHDQLFSIWGPVVGNDGIGEIRDLAWRAARKGLIQKIDSGTRNLSERIRERVAVWCPVKAPSS